MSKQVKIRRGTATQHATFTGVEGEITVDTTNDTIRVHDGATVGGHMLAKQSSLAGYLTTSTAASTYATISSLSSYLTTSAASSTYATISSLSSYLTTSAASSTYAPKASPAFSGNIDLSGSVRGNVSAVAASTVDCSLGNFFTKTATGALTWTFSNAPASKSFSFILELTNGGLGAQSWPAEVKWPGGTAPTLTAAGVDLLGFVTDDGGTTWRGVQLMKDSK